MTAFTRQAIRRNPINPHETTHTPTCNKAQTHTYTNTGWFLQPDITRPNIVFTKNTRNIAVRSQQSSETRNKSRLWLVLRAQMSIRLNFEGWQCHNTSPQANANANVRWTCHQPPHIPNQTAFQRTNWGVFGVSRITEIRSCIIFNDVMLKIRMDAANTFTSFEFIITRKAHIRWHSQGVKRRFYTRNVMLTASAKWILHITISAYARQRAACSDSHANNLSCKQLQQHNKHTHKKSKQTNKMPVTYFHWAPPAARRSSHTWFIKAESVIRSWEK